METKKIYYSLSLLLLLSEATIAQSVQQRTLNDAREIAQKQMEKSGIMSSVEQVVTTNYSKSLKSTDITPYYIFNNGDDKGFVIVSGDARMPEIVGYCTNGNFDTENIPDNCDSFLEAYEEFVESVWEGDSTALARVS